MDGGLPLLNCLWQQALRSFCSSTNSSKWVYAVFWRILPRNYPPPRWDDGQGIFDRSNGNKRNWILVWEDGFCDFYECERVGNAFRKGRSFGPDIFFKMSHEVYNYGEGLMGKVAADNSHKWVFGEFPTETDPNFSSSWNAPLDLQPKAWESQFNSGIQTIAVVAVKEGVIQLGSLDKVAEDLNLVINIQRKFNYLQSIPGIFAMQRPYAVSSDHYTNMPKHNLQISEISKCRPRLGCEEEEEFPSKLASFDWNKPMKGSFFQHIPPHLPSMSCSLGMLLSRLPSVTPPNSHAQSLTSARNNVFHAPNLPSSYSQNSSVKLNLFEVPENKPQLISHYSSDPCQVTAFLQEFDVQGMVLVQVELLGNRSEAIH
ncbi:transcription factor bHLH155 isoform X1 [Elaeis guineensis]|uniref:Uncharacterized protein LOC105049529 isoform X1 n=2 Tax=Elaeis guineensis var. tenera TaxID=51953 RepID=A0A6I9RJA1_ELAGV|nr:uncharacterized protein LOC105049529 isoform X1 [Elaeis guineensis]